MEGVRPRATSRKNEKPHLLFKRRWGNVLEGMGRRESSRPFAMMRLGPGIERGRVSVRSSTHDLSRRSLPEGKSNHAKMP